MRRPNGSEGGFTLIETLAALTVFSIMTIGVVPLLGSSIRSLGASRGRTVAENVARAAVERLQGIKYYVSWEAKSKKVDLLDLYLPQTAGTFDAGQSYSTATPNPPLASPASGGTGVFTTVCPVTAPAVTPACPPSIPKDHTVTYTASFVEPVTSTTPQSYRVVNPGSSYSARPALAGSCQVGPCNDKPPADLIDVKVTVSWPYGGTTQSFALRALVGERTFSSGTVTNAAPPSPGATPTPTPPSAPSSEAVRMQGRSTIDYVLRAETGYSLTTGSSPSACVTEPCNHSEMLLTIGNSEARVQTKDTSTADVNTRYAEGRVVRTYPLGTTPPANPPPDLTYATGATTIMSGPPNQTRAVDDARTGYVDVPNPDQPGPLQARIYAHENANMKVQVADELPQAEGTFRSPTGATGEYEWFINNSLRDPSSTGPMHMDTGQPIFLGMKYATTTGSSSLNGTTKVNTGALGTPERRVQSSASTRLPWMYVMPRIYAGRNGGDSFTMLSFFDFVANVDCKATANPATALATGSWSVSFQYYYDVSNNNRTSDHSLGQGTINSSGNDVLNGASVPDALAALKAQNPLIWDGSATNGCCTSTSDMYMFDVRTGSNPTRGYISDWSSNKVIETKKSSDGREVSAAINGALRIETAGLRQTVPPGDIPQTAVTMSLGKLSCHAVDNR